METLESGEAKNEVTPVLSTKTLENSGAKTEEPSIGDKCDTNTFTIRYLLDALISRGCIVWDQLCLQKRHWEDFLKAVLNSYVEDQKVLKSREETMFCS